MGQKEARGQNPKSWQTIVKGASESFKNVENSTRPEHWRQLPDGAPRQSGDGSNGECEPKIAECAAVRFPDACQYAKKSS